MTDIIQRGTTENDATPLVFSARNLVSEFCREATTAHINSNKGVVTLDLDVDGRIEKWRVTVEYLPVAH